MKRHLTTISTKRLALLLCYDFPPPVMSTCGYYAEVFHQFLSSSLAPIRSGGHFLPPDRRHRCLTLGTRRRRLHPRHLRRRQQDGISLRFRSLRRSLDQRHLCVVLPSSYLMHHHPWFIVAVSSSDVWVNKLIVYVARIFIEMPRMKIFGTCVCLFFVLYLLTPIQAFALATKSSQGPSGPPLTECSGRSA